jgi:hypothetical protein
MGIEELKKIFTYTDGKLIWNIDRSDKVKSGRIAGTLKKNGYIQINYNQKLYLAHRLIFLYHNGYIPKSIDHINGIRNDNRIENLRECNQQQNLFNKRPYGYSKYKGVYKCKNGFKSQIMYNSKLMYLGYYKTEKEAAIAYNKAALELHKDFAYLNTIL